jgi:drug/metabolite transporter (DMT)-like permease
MKLGLLVRLARNRIWLAGVACDIAGYVLQFVALGHGPIVVVQTLLVTGLLFALPVGAAWSGRHLATSDWLAALAVCAGLAVFLGVAAPAAGRNGTAPGTWAALLSGVSVLTALLVAWGRGPASRRRAVALGAAAGLVYGAAAALTKTTAHILDRGLFGVVAHWQLYGLAVIGVAGMLLAQSAFQAGALDLSLPAITVVDPVISIVIGVFAFHESIATGGGAIAVETVALLAMVVGVVVLARSEGLVAGGGR